MSRDERLLAELNRRRQARGGESSAVRRLLDELQAQHNAEWYRWVTEGQPELTPDEYDRRRKAAGLPPAKRRRSSSSP